MGFIEDDLASILADQVRLTGRGVVRWRGKTLNMTVDEDAQTKNDLAAAGFQVTETDLVLRGQRSALPTGSVRGDSITVDWETVQVRQIFPQGDGLEVLVLVAKP